MASFNLGRIKGDKGDTGPKGDTGSKGDKGDTGAKGADGMTPVFSVKATSTLNSTELANVEIDCTDPANPQLSFFIPRGRDGNSSYGDMTSDIYDPTGMKQDVYKYAKNLANGRLSIYGGNLAGALTVGEAVVSKGYVRNIIAGASLPDRAATGDICIITDDGNSKKLSECSEGSIMLIRENDEDVPYIITVHNYHEDNSVTLMRKDLYPHKLVYNYNNREKYIMSDIDVFLESIYKSVLSYELQRRLRNVKISDGVYRHCFLLDQSDYSAIAYLNEGIKRIAYRDGTTTKDKYMLRTFSGVSNNVIVTTTGSFGTTHQTVENYFRPVIVLSGDTPVINTEYDSSSAVKLPESSNGIYMRISGKWRECASL